MKKTIISIIILIIIMLLITWILIEQYQEFKINNLKTVTQEHTEKVSTIQNTYEENIITVPKQNENKEMKQYPKEEIIQTYKGYDVCAKLEIPSIDLETYVLKNYSVQALNVSVTKFWGANPNQIGNFCIAGHNFKNKNMFSNLKKVNIGEKIYITDNNVGKVEYGIYNIEKVIPQNVSCLDQETQDREVTLITCTNDSTLRIIVKAKEI